MSEKDLVIELLEIAEVEEDGTVNFSDRAREIIKELAAVYKDTPAYRKARNNKPKWVKTATAAEIYIQMCDRIVEAPTILHMMSAPTILIPILWGKIQAEDKRKAQAEDKTKWQESAES